MNLRKIFKPPIIREWTTLLREKGVKGFLREKGWKIFIGIVLFYLIRDTIVYLLIPGLLAQGLFCGK
ncbi:MAG: hypothetical protein ONB44_20005 [candidate division KSB1 bacterium]|nr:hypothetical protein [candidate division KSB1 bacterium]MDZ7304414.1 hypothetical protein [candidate division KSB1 bacterium]MDZ7313364.1 hypothetical protein [candidate division KSB1 bacterium]